MLLIELYTPQRITEYLFPVTLALAFDRVAEVRHAAFQVVGVPNQSAEGLTVWSSIIVLPKASVSFAKYGVPFAKHLF